MDLDSADNPQQLHQVPRVVVSTEEGPGRSAFPIVGIGYSAGGWEACRQLFAYLPDDTGMAFLLVQHLDPDHESRLADLLAKTSCMPVTEVAQDMAVYPN